MTTTIYVVNKYNRFSESWNVEYYMNKEKAEKAVEEIAKIYADAEAKGDNGSHWAKVVYSKAKITTIEVKN